MPRPSMLPFSVTVLVLALAAGCQRPGVSRTAPGSGGGNGTAGSGGTAGAGGGAERMDAGFGIPGNRDGGPGGGPGTGPGTEDPGSGTIEPIEDCETAAKAAGNVGCTFYSVPFGHSYAGFRGGCHAMFVVNQGRQPVKLRLDKGGAAIPLGPLARLPRGGGLGLTFLPYDEAAGLAGGDVAILFLRAGGEDATIQGRVCPAGVTPFERGAFPEQAETSFRSQAFRLLADRPVAAYQMFPYGGAGTHVASATLLLPTESWGPEHYVAAPEDATAPSFAAVIANEDGTEVTLRPTADLLPLPGMPATKQGERLRLTLKAGEYVWLTTPQTNPGPLPTSRKGLAASLVVSSKPVAVIGGAKCTNSPAVPPLLAAPSPACDTVQQQVPPISALGHEYAAVRHRSRFPNEEEPGAWHLMGAVDGTILSYSPSPPAGAPTALSAGQVVQFSTREPFIVRSQDRDHPFYLGAFMTGGGFPPKPELQGDPDFVNVLPVAQYQAAYVFFTDPTYPETNLVVVRQKGPEGRFSAVKLDCAATPITGWRPLGDLEYAWVDLVTGNFQPAIAGCDNGRRAITSSAPFAVTVWGWGRSSAEGPSLRSPTGKEGTQSTSYAFPAGGAVRRINRVQPPIE
jgi:hypothetical protein